MSVKITYASSNFNGCVVEVWEWISNFTRTLKWMRLLIHVKIKVNSSKTDGGQMHMGVTGLYMLEISGSLSNEENPSLLTSIAITKATNTCFRHNIRKKSLAVKPTLAALWNRY